MTRTPREGARASVAKVPALKSTCTVLPILNDLVLPRAPSATLLKQRTMYIATNLVRVA